MNCPACELAKQGQLTGKFHADCDGCKVRAVASGRELFQAQMAGHITPEYRALLIKFFGEERWLAFHDRVKRWIDTKEL